MKAEPSTPRLALVAFELHHLQRLRTWWHDPDEVLSWAGPAFRFPFDDESFLADLRLEDTTSYCLVDRGGSPSQEELVAFGQYYDLAGRVHLARLCVSPTQRGQGIGGRLVRELVRMGQQELGLPDASLYVKSGNLGAVRCYEKEGFAPHDPPEDPRQDLPGMEDVVFLVRRS